VKAELALLSLLMKEDMYGIEMVNRILIKPSTVYSALKAIENKRYANTYKQESKIGGRKRVYSITGTGRDYYNENKNQIDFKIINMPPKIEPKRQQDDDGGDDIAIVNNAANKSRQPYNNGIYILPLSKEEQYRVHITPEVAQAIEEQAPTENDELPPLPLLEIKEEPAPEPNANEDLPVKRSPSAITPYILPKEKILSTVQTQSRQISIDISGTKSPEINPLPKLNASTGGHGFVFYNKLKFFSNLITMFIVISVSYGLILLLPVSSGDEELTILSFVFSGIYFVVNLLVWLIFPRTKRKITRKFAEIIIIKRTLFSGVLLLAVLSIYLIATAHLGNTAAMFWGLIFAVVSLTPVIEGIFVLSLKKIKGFAC
jgi:DNA-binding PadR family transcriptional regulator